MGDGFFMQIPSQQSFSCSCIIAGFPWYFPEQSGKVIFCSVIFCPIFSGFCYFQLFVEPSNLHSFIYSLYSFPVIIIWAFQSDYMLFLFSFIVIKPFLCFKVFNPYSTQLLPAPTVWTSPLILQDYVFCSKISWFKLLLDVNVYACKYIFIFWQSLT